MIQGICLCLVMTVIGGPPRAFGHSPDEAVILQSLLSDGFLSCKIGEFYRWVGRISPVKGVTGASRNLVDLHYVQV